MKNMYSLFLSPFFLLIALTASAQVDHADRPSPPASTKATLLNNANISVAYSSPAVNGRKIWDGLVPYGQVWRTGANEATIMETDKDILINGKTLPAGKYSLFTIPGENEWIFIFNHNWNQWGAFSYESSKDVLRVTAIPQKSLKFNERMKFTISDNIMTLLWENKQVNLTLK